MNVLLLRDLRSERRASMERYADELECALMGVPGQHAESWAPNESPMEGAALPNKLANYRRRFVTYPRALRQLPADLYHIVDHAYAHLLWGLPPERTVVTCHDLSLLTRREWDGRASMRPAALMLRYSAGYLRRAGRVIAVSEATKRDLMRFGLARPEAVTVVPNGVSDTFLCASPRPDPETRRRLVQAAGEAVVLHVGTAAPQKNLPTVLACVAELRRRGLSARLVRVGPPLSPRLQRLARQLGVDSCVTELGRIGDTTLARVYASSDVLLFPSLKEGFGWPPLEAMACGLPVVTSTDPALLEVTAGSALHAPARDVHALTAACLRLLGDAALRERYRQDGMARARKYTWSRTAEQVAVVYERLGTRPRDVPVVAP